MKIPAKQTVKNSLLKIMFMLTLALSTAAGTAIAHPGHGVDHDHPWSVLHYLGSPRHALVIVAGLAVVGSIAFGLWKSRRKSESEQ